MPSYRCSACGQRTQVPNTRGSRIRDHACAHCGATGTLQGATAGRASKQAGRHYERCAACGKRGLDHAHPPFPWEPKYYYTQRPGPFPAGSPGCWREDPVPAARTRHASVHRDLQARHGPHTGWASDAEERQLGLLVGEDRWSDPRLQELCGICGHQPDPATGRRFSHHLSAYRFERAVAAVLVCDACGHTRLIAELATNSPAPAATKEPRP